MNDPLATLFVSTTPSPELGPGPRAEVLSLSDVNQRVEAVVSANGLTAGRAETLRSLVLLWHDHHDAAHALVQDMTTTDAAYVHAILHRREPDYFNAKYWFRRVGEHPCHDDLAKLARSMSQSQGLDKLISNLGAEAGWNAMAFVDACKSVAGSRAESVEAQVLRKVQQAEFELLARHLVSAPN